MARYIDAVELIKAIEENQRNTEHHKDGRGKQIHVSEHRHFIKMVYEQPTADVQEVRHGRCNMCNGREASLQDEFSGYWIDIDTKRQELNIWHGDECLANIHIDYCPNCGAKIDWRE